MVFFLKKKELLYFELHVIILKDCFICFVEEYWDRRIEGIKINYLGLTLSGFFLMGVCRPELR